MATPWGNTDESRILSWSGDGTVRLWDAANGSELARLVIGSEAVDGAVWNADESRALAYCKDGTVALWDISSQ